MNQIVTPELRRWIVEQAEAGHRPEAVLEAMKSSGWQEPVAIEALEMVLSERLAERSAGATEPVMPAAVALPEPDLRGTPPSIWAHDREVRVVMAMHDPRVVVFANLLGENECEEIIQLARQRLERSHTVDMSTGDSEVNAARTSEGMFFVRAEHPVCARLEARLAALLNWPVENGEGLQVLRYRPGAEYKPHYDYFDPAQPGTPTILKRGGQRLATIVMYLNTPLKGGGTTFPDVQLEVAPQRGHAVFFSYDRPLPATRTLHGGAPVLEGEKWVATKWLRAGRFD
ncbi:2OG-Fe(II) oxygenase [Rivibacter subsaxonicus]|uniref:Prolyl 4-hydroxylase n=1 Tax=Rivibacter subsaxonicus TaxID=457575 RepID=A0A4Q7W1Z9_9BURK|nr:2OG-Fe(II) oxygenase [Rivibacter subsaxonicus]RZU03103.1 prolyl 4-hydroxylase [Rivibacter subsaxonicus]